MLSCYQLHMQNPLCESVNAWISSLNYNQLLKQVRAWKASTVTCWSCIALSSVPADTKHPPSGRWALIPQLVSVLVQEGCWAAWWPLISSGACVQCLGGTIPALAHCWSALSMTSSTVGWFKHELNCCTNIGTKCFKLLLLIWQKPQIQGCGIYCLALVPQCMYLISLWQDSSCSHPLNATCTSSPYHSRTTKGEGTCTCGLTGKGKEVVRCTSVNQEDGPKMIEKVLKHFWIIQNLLSYCEFVICLEWGRMEYRKVNLKMLCYYLDTLGNGWSSFDLVKQFWESPWFLWKAGTPGTVQGLQFKQFVECLTLSTHSCFSWIPGDICNGNCMWHVFHTHGLIKAKLTSSLFSASDSTWQPVVSLGNFQTDAYFCFAQDQRHFIAVIKCMSQRAGVKCCSKYTKSKGELAQEMMKEEKGTSG